ncbi:MAG: RluA family pseudouridine synthase [Actinomycetota bacterium]|nr:RluA family pseudouridine synthase [Actinomycetota bacterium]
MGEVIRIKPEDDGKRLDLFFSQAAGISRARAQMLIEQGYVRVDEKIKKKNHILQEGEVVYFDIPPEPPQKVIPEDLPLEIAYEDEHLLAVNKPAGMAMYPGPGHSSGTLLNALMWRYPELENVGGSGRQGIFHRLDKDTSGLVMIARRQEAFQKMIELMRKGFVERKYLALVSGQIEGSQGIIDAPVGRSQRNRKKMAVNLVTGKEAVSRFKVLELFPQGYTLIEVALQTGRTHQIRVHFSYIGHPVVGDKQYSKGRDAKQLGLKRQFLHAYYLKSPHPVTGIPIELRSELSQDLKEALEKLRSEYGHHS